MLLGVSLAAVTWSVACMLLNISAAMAVHLQKALPLPNTLLLQWLQSGALLRGTRRKRIGGHFFIHIVCREWDYVS